MGARVGLVKLHRLMIWPARDSQRRPLTDTAEHFNLPVDNKAILRLSNNQTSTITLSDETWQSWFVSFGKFFHFKAANQKKNENHNFRIQFHFFHEFKTDFLFFLFSILSEKRENEKKSNYEHLTKNDTEKRTNKVADLICIQIAMAYWQWCAKPCRVVVCSTSNPA